ncbi:MAG: hypothetical protein ABIA37_01025 [Candidatus Woesearchaeota archaeon]
MPNLIIFDDKEIQAKGLDKNNRVDKDKLKNYLFDDDLERLELLNKINKLKSAKENPLLFYPGCGSDILFPLFYLERLFPEVKEINLVLVDEMDCSGIIKTILDDVGISFSEEKEQIRFYYNSVLINLTFIVDDVFKMDLPVFDIYFEKAFRIIKEGQKGYERKIFEQLSSGGIIISDSGFQGLKLDYLLVPKNLSSYNKMCIGIKS